jgi:hypothetical protein
MFAREELVGSRALAWQSRLFVVLLDKSQGNGLNVI